MYPIFPKRCRIRAKALNLRLNAYQSTYNIGMTQPFAGVIRISSLPFKSSDYDSKTDL